MSYNPSAFPAGCESLMTPLGKVLSELIPYLLYCQYTEGGWLRPLVTISYMCCIMPLHPNSQYLDTVHYVSC